MNCQECEALSGAYVLDALTEEERRAVDAHLRQCDRCREIVQQMRTVIDLFPLTVPPVDPPPRVKERILERIATQHSGAYQPANVTRRVGWLRGPQVLAVVAVVLLLILCGGMLAWNISLQQQISLLASRPLLTSPTIYPLYETGGAARVSGQILVFPRQQATIVLVSGLPPLSGSHVYQGWLLQGKQPTSIGLFHVKNGVATLEIEHAFNTSDEIAVSLEPGPTPSLLPQGPILARGSLSQASSVIYPAQNSVSIHVTG